MFTTPTLEDPRYIDLHLPRSWNQATTDELEQIAAVITRRTLTADRYHPFDWDEAKVELILRLNGLEIVRMADTVPADMEYIVRFRRERPRWWQLFRRLRYQRSERRDNQPFPLSVGHIHAMLPMLSWIDDEKAEPLLRFPYETITLRGITLQGPPPMMDGYTWEEYRHLQDWMSAYVSASNALTRLQQSRRADAASLKAALTRQANAQQQFLAVLFRADNQSPQSSRSNQRPLKSPTDLFADFDPIRWQVILFFWSGLMRHLITAYPKCFKKEKGAAKRTNPLELYSRTTATLQKYIGLTEQDVNRETYTVTLRKLEMMAEEADEMKKLNQKYKSKSR